MESNVCDICQSKQNYRDECVDCGRELCAHTLIEYEYDRPDPDIGWEAAIDSLCKECAIERRENARRRDAQIDKRFRNGKETGNA